MIVPIFLPQYRSRCPGCGRDECTRRTCVHCGYRYAPPSAGLVALGVAAILAVVVTLFAIGVPASVCWTDPWTISNSERCHLAQSESTLVSCVAHRVCLTGELLGRLW